MKENDLKIASQAFFADDLVGLFVTGSVLISSGFFKYFVRSFLINFVYKAFSEYSPKSLFKEILLLILSLISIAFRTTCFMPRSLLIMADFSKSILWLGFSKTWLLKAESKEIEVILEFRALVISSLCCCRRFSKFWGVLHT